MSKIILDTDKPDYGAAALYWYERELIVLPIKPDTKCPAVSWDRWERGLTSHKIRQHWTKHSDHQVGHIVGDDLIVYDADTPESLLALKQLEDKHGVTPFLVIGTRRGEHHYFVRPNGVTAKSASFSTTQRPDCIDIKTGRAIAILPPSTGKRVLYDAF